MSILNREQMDEDLTLVRQTTQPTDSPDDGSIGRTTFDSPSSEDLLLTVLLSQERVQIVPSQSLVRIACKGGKHHYLGVVEAGPFYEPDSLRADSPILTAVATTSATYLPRFHARLGVKILGEQLTDGNLAPPRLRPLPHSPVYLLDSTQTAQVLRTQGDIRLGLALGHDQLPICLPSTNKNILPRHTAILGTTGGGKSTTVSGLVSQAAAAGLAVIVLDVEGEYSHLNQPMSDPRTCSLLTQRGLRPAGLGDRMVLYHLVGRDTTNPKHPHCRPFSLQFARLSPYAAMAMMECNDAQTDRFLFAYEVAKILMRQLGIFPQKDADPSQRERQEAILARLDDLERGYPRLTLQFMLDVVNACKASITKGVPILGDPTLRSPEGQEALQSVLKARDVPSNAASWGKVYSLLLRLHRLRVFDRRDQGARLLNYKDMLRPGQVSVLDLSDSGLSYLSNIAVADILRGLQEEQDRLYRAADTDPSLPPPPRVLIVIEEAHEFLSSERTSQTPHLFEQVERLAKRGRKRWLSLALVTQLPQHLPRSVLAMCNNFILHKLTDPQVIATLKQTLGSVDDSLWKRLPSLAPGQAVVSFGHLARPVLVSIDPSVCQLRLMS
ncbi:MAG: ATP-binding protein [Gemmataceae bacterium]